MSSFALDFPYSIYKRKLRSLERLAYSSVVTSLRAQGSLTSEKKKLLQELQSVLHISLPVHKAEIRRVVNCQILHTIAERTEGPNTASEWAIEGRRLCPLIPRVPAETEYTRYANEIVKAYKAEVTRQIAASKATDSGPHEVIDLQSDTFNRAAVQTDVEEIELDVQSIMKPQILEESAPPKKDIRGRKKGEKRKHEPLEIDNDSHKIMVIDPPSEESSFQQSLSDESMKMSSTVYSDSTLCPISASKAAVGSIRANKANSPKTALPGSSKLRFSLPSQTLFASTPTVQSCVPYVNPISSALKTVAAPSATPISNQLEITDSVLAVTAASKLSKHSLASDSASCSVSSSVVNSVTAPLLSVSVDNLVTDASTSFMNVTETKAKNKMLPLSKKLFRPKLTRSNFNIGSPALLNLPSTSQNPSPSTVSTLQKTVLSLKSHSSSTTASSTSSSSTPVTSGSTLFKRPISPIRFPSKFGPPAISTSKMKSSLTLKYCQPKISDSSSKESVLSGLKDFAKSFGIVSALGTKTVSHSHASSKITSSDAITTWKPSNTPKALPPAKVSGPLNMPQKFLTTHISTKPAPISRRIQFGSDGGLKIMSANTSCNPILPKSGALTSETAVITATDNMTSTSAGLTKNAKIVNLTRPIKLDRSRFNLYSTPTSASNIVSTSGVHVCSAPPVSTSNGKAILPAKPNVIVVHKAKVLPQTSGAAIVMPPTGTFSQLSDEVIKDNIHSVPNKESGKQTNVPGKQKLFSDQPSHTITSTVSNISSFPSTSTNTITLTAEQVLKEKKLERHSSIKLPGTAQAITLIERKIPGRSLATPPERIKFPMIKQHAPFLSVNSPFSSKITPALPKEIASCSKTKIECNVQRRFIHPRESNSIIRRPLDADNNYPSKKLKLSVPIVDKPQSKKKHVSDSTILHKDAVFQQTNVKNDGEANSCDEDESQEAIDYLKQHGHLNKKVLHILKQVGLQIQLDEDEEESPVVDNENLSHPGSFLQSTELMSDSFEEIMCEDQESQSDMKYGIPYTCNRDPKFKSPNCT